jgi:hypothetical protein
MYPAEAYLIVIKIASSHSNVIRSVLLIYEDKTSMYIVFLSLLKIFLSSTECEFYSSNNKGNFYADYFALCDSHIQ